MRTRGKIALVGVAVLAAGGLATAGVEAAAGCRVGYTVTSQWQGGFGASVDVTNLGDPVDGWSLRWTYTGGQTVTQLWNGVVSQSGAEVTVKDAGYNAAL